MKTYICSVCGYMYEETAGIPDDGIAPGTKWEDLPSGWSCPVCGAPKDDFLEQESDEKPAAKSDAPLSTDAHIGELSASEISAVCSNLAKGCEKQYLVEATECFNKLAAYYKSISHAPEKSQFSDLADLVKKNLDTDYAEVNAVAEQVSDRGAMRALVWGEKVTRMLSSVLTRYGKQKEDLLKDTNIHVCEICGFVYIGDEPPQVCPVCKVPRFKNSKIGREAM